LVGCVHSTQVSGLEARIVDTFDTS
jgi:hypothetical protein